MVAVVAVGDVERVWRKRFGQGVADGAVAGHPPNPVVNTVKVGQAAKVRGEVVERLGLGRLPQHLGYPCLGEREHRPKGVFGGLPQGNAPLDLVVEGFLVTDDRPLLVGRHRSRQQHPKPGLTAKALLHDVEGTGMVGHQGRVLNQAFQGFARASAQDDVKHGPGIALQPSFERGPRLYDIIRGRSDVPNHAHVGAKTHQSSDSDHARACNAARERESTSVVWRACGVGRDRGPVGLRWGWASA